MKTDRTIQIIKTKEIKTVISQNELIEKRDYLAQSIAKFQAEVDVIDQQLSGIEIEYGKIDVAYEQTPTSITIRSDEASWLADNLDI